MRIFITGGNGLIGKKVVSILEKEGHKIYSFDKFIKYKNTKKVSYFKGDILNFGDLQKKSISKHVEKCIYSRNRRRLYSREETVESSPGDG